MFTCTVQFKGRVPDLNHLANTLAVIIRAGNVRAALAGLDIEDEDYAPLKPSTIARGRGGDGAPLDPRHEESRIVRNFRIRKTVTKDTIRLSCYWHSCSWLRFHETGTKHMARRDPVGVRPTEQRLIIKAVKSTGREATITMERS